MNNIGQGKFFIHGFSPGYGKTIITAVLMLLRWTARTTQINKPNEENKEKVMLRINLNAHRNVTEQGLL